jgi:protein CpxP
MKRPSQPRLCLFAFAVCAAMPSIRAQDNTYSTLPPSDTPAPAVANPGPGAARPARGGPMMQQIKEKLGLSDAQARQMAEIMKDRQKQGKDLRDDTTLSREDRKSKMDELTQATRGKIRAILTPDQQKTFDQMPALGAGHRPPPPAKGVPDGPPPETGAASPPPS